MPGWLPSAAVTLHYAAGGEGKALLAQMLMTLAATGLPWLGLPVTRCRAMGLFCEDDADEMHRRQDAICRAYRAELRDLGDMRRSCPVGDDNTLIRFEPDGSPVMTDRFADFVVQAKVFRPGLVVLNVAADLFGGNGNVRQQVPTFLKFCLGGLARDLEAAVLLNAHPSRAGISNGDMDGSSTGWNGGARSRWALVTPREDGEPVDETARVLTKRKANYSTRGDEIRLRFRDGVLEREGGLGIGIVAGLERRNCEAVFLDLLDKVGPTGRHASDSRNSGHYAPKDFSQRPDRQGFTKRAFEVAMSRPFAAGTIRVEAYGKPSDRTHHIVRATPGEGPEQGSEGVRRRWGKVADFCGRRWGWESVPLLRKRCAARPWGSVAPLRGGQASMLNGCSGLVVVSATVLPKASTTEVTIDPSGPVTAVVLSPGVLAAGVPVAGPDGCGAMTGCMAGSLPMLATLSLMVRSSPLPLYTSTRSTRATVPVLDAAVLGEAGVVGPNAQPWFLVVVLVALAADELANAQP